MNKKLGQKFDTASGVVRLSSAAVSSSTSTAVPPPPPPQSSQCVVYLQNYIALAYYKALQNSKSFLGLTTCHSHHTQLCENISSNKGCSRRGVIIEQARNFTKIFKIKQKISYINFLLHT